MSYPYVSNMPNIPNPYSQAPPLQPIEEEIKKLKIEIKQLNERITALEKKDTKNYLQKEDGFYMV